MDARPIWTNGLQDSHRLIALVTTSRTDITMRQPRDWLPEPGGAARAVTFTRAWVGPFHMELCAFTKTSICRPRRISLWLNGSSTPFNIRLYAGEDRQ